MVELSQKLLQYGVEFLGSRISLEEANLLKATKDAIVAKILSTRDISVPSHSAASNGHHSPNRRQSYDRRPSSSSYNKRPHNSRSPSPPPRVKRER